LHRTDKNRLHLQDEQLEDVGNVHFGWARRPDPVIGAAVQWLQNQS